MRKRYILSAAAAAVALCAVGSQQARATGYASELTLTGGTGVSFRLNEGASNVKLLVDGATSIDLGSQNKGVVTYTLPSAASKVQVVVTTSDAAGYLTDEGGDPLNGHTGDYLSLADMTTWGAPRGVAVDNNPASATFGRVYVANSTNDANKGFYVLDSDMTYPVGSGPVASGITMAPNTSTSSPWTIAVGNDGYLYEADWSNPACSIYRAQQSVTQGLINGVNVLSGIGNPPPPGANHADVTGIVVEGSTDAGNLKVWSLDSSFGGSGNYQRLYRWDVGSSTSGYAGMPVGLANPLINTVSGVTASVARGGPANQFYMMQNRYVGNEAGVFAISPDDDTTAYWSSLLESRRIAGNNTVTDDFKQVRGIITSADGRFMALPTDTSGYTWVVPLLAGIPDLTTRRLLPITGGSTGRQPAFDAAGNLYVTSYGNFDVAAPGGNSVTVTGSDGTFVGSAQWSSSGNGNISDPTRWFVGNAPNGADQVATFGPVGTGAHTVTIDQPTTLGAIMFTSPAGYTLDGSNPNALTLGNFGANITAQAGSNTISAPVSLVTSTGLYAATGASVTVSGPITMAADINLVKNGHGTVALSGINLVSSSTGAPFGGNLSIYAGKLALTPGTGNAVVNYLFMQPGAMLDLANHSLVVNYTASGEYARTFDTVNNVGISPLSQIQSWLASGYDHGRWDGPGIVSSNAANTAAGTSLAASDSGTAVTVMYTWIGDANMDGKVDNTDLSAITPGGTGWAQGDFNYDGVVNADDYALFDVGLSISKGANISSVVPEPASLSLLGLAAAALIRRRRQA